MGMEIAHALACALGLKLSELVRKAEWDTHLKLQELPKLPNFGLWQLKTKTDLRRPHQTEITVLGQFHVTLTPGATIT